MRIAIDFDGTIVQQNREYADVMSPLQFMPGAEAGLRALKKAGHELILWSARANLALCGSWWLNPAFPTRPEWLTDKTIQTNSARRRQMHEFVKTHLPEVFSFIDEGRQGKVLADLFIDDRNFPLTGVDWDAVVAQFGGDASSLDPSSTPEEALQRPLHG